MILSNPAIELGGLIHTVMCDRFGLVRVRENAESIAFYGGEESEAKLLFQRLGKVVANYGDLLVTSRNLSFFTSFYRHVHDIILKHAVSSSSKTCASECSALKSPSMTHLLQYSSFPGLGCNLCSSQVQLSMCFVCRFLIQILPAAVVAPLFFRGEIEFGVINQSSSAFNHILSDVSLVVYQVPLPVPPLLNSNHHKSM